MEEEKLSSRVVSDADHFSWFISALIQKSGQKEIVRMLKNLKRGGKSWEELEQNISRRARRQWSVKSLSSGYSLPTVSRILFYRNLDANLKVSMISRSFERYTDYRFLGLGPMPVRCEFYLFWTVEGKKISPLKNQSDLNTWWCRILIRLI